MCTTTSNRSTDSNDSALLRKSPENPNVARSNSSAAEQVLRRIPSLAGVVVLGPESKHAKVNNHDGNTVQSKLENVMSESLNEESNTGICIYDDNDMTDANG